MAVHTTNIMNIFLCNIISPVLLTEYVSSICERVSNFFCQGLSEELRTDFRVRKDLDVHTKIGPKGRVEELKNFMKSLNSNQESQKRLKNWNIKFSDNLAEIPGHVLGQQRKSFYLTPPSVKCVFVLRFSGLSV